MNEVSIDPTVIERMVSFGGNKLKIQLIDMFLEKMPERAALINQGILSRQADLVERTAHSLISSAGNLGGFAVSKLAAQLEAAAMQSDFESLTAINERITLAIQEFEAFLKQQKDLP